MWAEDQGGGNRAGGPGPGGHPLAAGIGRSLRLYYGDRARTARMDALNARFVRRGDLLFDVGAHVGDRTASFRRLGARVVAVEPQPAAMRALCLIHGRDPGVTLVRAALGARRGTVRLRINVGNPTVSSASDALVDAARTAEGWRAERWERATDVAVLTGADLIARYGAPAFAKIDVEGYEAEVVSGLGAAIPALSLEFTTLLPGVAMRAVDALMRLGPYVFNLSMGEAHRLDLPRWVSAREIGARIAAMPAEANSGDVYARLDPGGGKGAAR